MPWCAQSTCARLQARGAVLRYECAACQPATSLCHPGAAGFGPPPANYYREDCHSGVLQPAGMRQLGCIYWLSIMQFLLYDFVAHHVCAQHAHAHPHAHMSHTPSSSPSPYAPPPPSPNTAGSAAPRFQLEEAAELERQVATKQLATEQLATPPHRANGTAAAKDPRLAIKFREFSGDRVASVSGCYGIPLNQQGVVDVRMLHAWRDTILADGLVAGGAVADGTATSDGAAGAGATDNSASARDGHRMTSLISWCNRLVAGGAPTDLPPTPWQRTQLLVCLEGAAWSVHKYAGSDVLKFFCADVTTHFCRRFELPARDCAAVLGCLPPHRIATAEEALHRATHTILHSASATAAIVAAAAVIDGALRGGPAPSSSPSLGAVSTDASADATVGAGASTDGSADASSDASADASADASGALAQPSATTSNAAVAAVFGGATLLLIIGLVVLLPRATRIARWVSRRWPRRSAARAASRTRGNRLFTIEGHNDDDDDDDDEWRATCTL